jgi:hypothetical protein
MLPNSLAQGVGLANVDAFGSIRIGAGKDVDTGTSQLFTGERLAELRSACNYCLASPVRLTDDPDPIGNAVSKEDLDRCGLRHGVVLFPATTCASGAV